MKNIRDYFRMSKGEFWGTFVMLAVITMLLLVYLFYENSPAPPPDLSAFATQIAKFEARQRAYGDSVAAARAARDSLYQQRYAQRPRYPRPAYSHRAYAREKYPQDTARYPPDTAQFQSTVRKKQYAISIVELNSCDTSDIVQIPQFGSKRAAKIIAYRDQLGGFHSLEQLHEIYILQNIDLAYCGKYFVADPNRIRKIKVNSVSYQELKSHPYFDAYLAKRVISYREKSGKIQNLAEFQKITHAYQELMDKLAPYLSFE